MNIQASELLSSSIPDLGEVSLDQIDPADGMKVAQHTETGDVLLNSFQSGI